jgi:hypothetical protein
MSQGHTRTALFSGIVALAAALAACGGGGGGSGGGGNPGGGGPPPTSSPAPTSAANGTVSVNGAALANARVVFTCGCSAQAGETTADGSGNFTLTATATATPSSPSPTYTMVPGRNYMVIGANSSTHLEAWTMLFLGNQPSTNVYLGSGGADTTDVATTAAALYIFLKSQNNSDTSFDDWNFNQIMAWSNELRSAPKTSQEQKLMTDIGSAETAGTPLFPTLPSWDPDPGSANATIESDINAISASSDSNIPTPCPVSGGTPACTGTPTP